MSLSGPDRGFVFVCGRDGAVQQVVRDDFGLSPRIHTGSRLDDVVEEWGREKAAGFLSELQTGDAAYDWEMPVAVDGGSRRLRFTGARLDQGFLVVVTSTDLCRENLDGELMRINSEQTNVVRQSAKQLALSMPPSHQHDEASYEELTRVNNEMANLQREMAKKNAALDRLNAQKNRLVGMAAHDLRNPLGVIRTYAEFLESEAASVLNEEQLEFVTTIKEQSEFMLRMVTDLLDVTAIESGQLVLDKQPGDIARLVQRNVSLNRALAAKKDITIDFETPCAPRVLLFDVGKIEQVLNNLITNAVKFSHNGTRIRVELECAADAVTISVRDHGQGIPAKDLPLLFKPFSKTSVRATGGEQSTGLGLSIVRRMVEGHGGKIWVESTVGEGSSFRFTLPMTQPNG